jgi:hypothetical protein
VTFLRPANRNRRPRRNFEQKATKISKKFFGSYGARFLL